MMNGIRRKITRLFCALALCGQANVLAAPVRLHVENAATGAVLMSVARMGGFNLLLADNISSTVTINVKAEPEKLLELLTASKGLLLEKYDDVYVVTAPGQNNALRRVHMYKAQYARPADLAKIANLSLFEAGKKSQTTNLKNSTRKTKAASEQEAPTESRASRVMVDESAGAVLFYGTDAEAQKVQQAMQQVDIPARQVSIEAEVVAVSRNAAKNLGIEWEWSKLPQYPEHSKTYRNAGKSNERVEVETRRTYNGKTGSIPGIIRFGHGPEGYPFEFYFGAKVNALVTEGKAKLLARPNITTIQGHEAIINIGGDVPVPTQTVSENSTTNTVTYRQAGIILRCTPRVNSDGQITTEVHTEVSTPEYVPDLKAYRFNRRSADTIVRLQDGETMVIGGLIGSEESRAMSKIPILGDLPFFRLLFRNVQHSHTESEVMIFLKAHVL
ncbi:secretin N-terminal domain-containing protein [Selenomonas ruminantium]|uniref:Type IV pilus assembly protein PilQ n=1 Tax=Selenomonas ruminantium TaxID=971 RepID=A0A1H0TF06_SELRU|nr:secretin N-terminal domain-containing protein [Selenomonas ruminantium]SDP52415.1 type IV pilus assembly protein PilQ [Selenomonas ruminantium]